MCNIADVPNLKCSCDMCNDEISSIRPSICTEECKQQCQRFLNCDSFIVEERNECFKIPMACISDCSNYASCFVVETCIRDRTCFQLSSDLYKMYYEMCLNKPTNCDDLCHGYKHCFSCEPTCNSNCHYDSDGECDDGGIGSQYSECPEGSDCGDCGERVSRNCSLDLIDFPPPPLDLDKKPPSQPSNLRNYSPSQPPYLEKYYPPSSPSSLGKHPPSHPLHVGNYTPYSPPIPPPYVPPSFPRISSPYIPPSSSSDLPNHPPSHPTINAPVLTPILPSQSWSPSPSITQSLQFPSLNIGITLISIFISMSVLGAVFHMFIRRRQIRPIIHNTTLTNPLSSHELVVQSTTQPQV